MAQLLVQLLGVVEVSVISGGQFSQFQSQLVENLPLDNPEALGRLHLMPTCGTQYYRYVGDNPREAFWHQQYAENLTKEEKKSALRAVEGEARV